VTRDPILLSKNLLKCVRICDRLKAVEVGSTRFF
jgi:hypothetical protein